MSYNLNLIISILLTNYNRRCHYLKYYGKLIIGETNCTFELKDYTLTIFSESDVFLGWKNLNSILDDNNWLYLNDNDNHYLYLKIDGIDYLGKRQYCYSVAGYLLIYSHYDSISKKTLIKNFSFEHVILRNDVLDYFFKNDNTFIKNASLLLADWYSPNDETITPSKRPSYEIIINENKYIMDFMVMIEGTEKPFPFNINNAIKISGNKSSNIEELWKIVKTIQFFLKFIAQSPNINFDHEIYAYEGYNINENRTFFYLRPEKDYTLRPNRILEYSVLKDNVGKIINLISSNKIYFRSLFSVDTDLITYADIMNACAAFESQYDSFYGEFKDNTKTATKRKMLKLITDNKDSFAAEELSHYEDILNGFRNYRDTLKQRIDHALSEFVDIYGDEYIKFDFEQDYPNMSTRIKDARNALDHGNKELSLSRNTFLDAELLRAITYMLILKEADVPNAQTKQCLKKLSRFPY